MTYLIVLGFILLSLISFGVGYTWGYASGRLRQHMGGGK